MEFVKGMIDTRFAVWLRDNPGNESYRNGFSAGYTQCMKELARTNIRHGIEICDLKTKIAELEAKLAEVKS